MKNIIKILFFLLVTSNLNAQSNLLKGYYLDTWKYKPERQDSVYFELYPDGTNKVFEDKESVLIDYYKDQNYKQPSLSIYVNKFVRNIVPDSFKQVFYYDANNFNYKTISLEKIAFRQSGGCFVYKNQKNKDVWKIRGIAYNQSNKNGDIIKTKLCSERENYRRDTTYYYYKYQYDDKKNIIQEESYLEDSLTTMVKYEYRKDYKKIEVYYSDKSLKMRTEKFYKEDLLIKEKIYHNYFSNKYTYDNEYTYNEKKCKVKMITYYSNEKRTNDLIRTRKYNYN